MLYNIYINIYMLINCNFKSVVKKIRTEKISRSLYHFVMYYSLHIMFKIFSHPANRNTGNDQQSGAENKIEGYKKF